MKAVFTAQEFAELLNITTNQLFALVKKGLVPKPFIRTEKIARWRASDVKHLLEEPANV